ncbi:YARHG domain-containing protein [Pedobacter xixiisoli]|uniref:YARHG domain-containing protein n=1 Tax=Pedobacter xixiisoli TaxID=1476464 RepID=A0A286A8U3_9SPHI|nr:YARHG domain-containing protein [Pedobacter xixiisoli]SOD18336.1 YARHG domain-containing protein [Pedobacter xixiisoli]
MKKIIYILFLVASSAFAQQKTAGNNCPCTVQSAISEWKPEFKKGFDQKSIFNSFAYTVNGIYIAEDRDTVYQIKIIVDPKSYGTFVYYQHLSFSKARLMNKQVTLCETSTNVHDGGWIGNNIFEPKNAINKQFVASSFFVGESYLRIDKSHFFRLYKCDKKNEFGIHDADRQRYYRKTYWEIEGDYPEISMRSFTQIDVKKYNKQQLAEMRNTIYARYNYAFKEGGKWYQHFNKKPDYRWNHFKDVTPFLTHVEKENIKYITAFESADYYDNQYKNDFIDFWQKFRITVQENNTEKLFPFIQFPFIVNGEHDGMPELKISQQQFAKIWPMLLQQENYDINGTNKLVSWLSKSVFSKVDPFAELMLHTKTNSIANLDFGKLNGTWKMSGAYADTDLYPKIQSMLMANKPKSPAKKN